MKVTEDRRTKAGTLSLALERFENSPKYHLESHKESDLVEVKRYERKVGGFIEKRSNSKEKLQKPAQADEQTEEDIFAMCNTLTSRIQVLKKQKYDHVVKQFEQEERRRLKGVLGQDTVKINEKYGAIRKQLKASHDQQKLKIMKSLEDIKKFRDVYMKMLQELETKKSKVNLEYQSSIGVLKDQKQKLIGEWKRNSNEQIFKLGLKMQ